MKFNKLCQHLYVHKFILFKEPSNSSKFKLLSTSSTKKEGGLQSILGSFCQFVLTKINLSKLFDCK